MTVSVFELFTIGIGRSSSHTVGPMRAARTFCAALTGLDSVFKVHIDLFGSLAATGHGHGTMTALLLGLEGADPESIDPDHIPAAVARIRDGRAVRLLGRHPITFDESDDIVLRRQRLDAITSRSTRSSRPCETPAPTCTTNTRRPHAEDSPSTSSSADAQPAFAHQGLAHRRRNCCHQDDRAAQRTK